MSATVAIPHADDVRCVHGVLPVWPLGAACRRVRSASGMCIVCRVTWTLVSATNRSSVHRICRHSPAIHDASRAGGAPLMLFVVAAHLSRAARDCAKCANKTLWWAPAAAARALSCGPAFDYRIPLRSYTGAVRARTAVHEGSC